MIPDTGAARLSERHFAPLDGLRGLAILVVMLHHFEFLLPAGYPLGDVVKGILYSGWSGVDLFFVLSGFLITGILIDTRYATNYFSSFYGRRVLRIFPLYYCVLSGIVILASILRQPWLDRLMPLPSDRIFYFFYLNNWWVLLKDTWHGNIIGHFWSLAVEEQFYLVWPCCVWLVPRHRLLSVGLGGCAAALVLRLVLVLTYGPSHAIDQNTFTRMDTLLAGACCAIVVRDKSMITKVRPWLTGIILLAAISVFCIDIFADELRSAGYFMETAGFSLLSAGYAALLLHVFLGYGDASTVQKLFRSDPLVQLGKYSYGVYVLHVPILTIAIVFLGAPLGLGTNVVASTSVFVTLIVVSYLAAKMSYKLLERRFLQLKDRFSPQFASNSPTQEEALRGTM